MFRFIGVVWICLLCSLPTFGQIDLNTQQWIHGSEDCEKNTDAPIQVVRYDENTWILRQNKCLNYEAPFMFLFVGEDKALLMDTGATKSADEFPLYKTVREILDRLEGQQNKKIELIVAHTHKHGDHYAADAQFNDKPNTTVVGIEKSEVINFFKFKNWPLDEVYFDLGSRQLKIIPIPGHQEASIAVYDTSTKWLLTGDTFYPGRLYVDDWSAFKNSIKKLADFTAKNEISYILGNHIEMSSKDGVDYPIRTTYQPKERKLPLDVKDLKVLHEVLEELGDKPVRKVLKNVIISPN